MKFLLSIFLLLSINSCASENIVNKDVNMSQKNTKIQLEVGETDIELEVLNLEYNSVDKKCLVHMIHKFNNMMKNKNYNQQKHITTWNTHNYFSYSDNKNAIIHILINKEKSSLIILNNVEPKDKIYMDYYRKHRYNPRFEILPKPLAAMKSEWFFQGSSKETIDFEACFK